MYTSYTRFRRVRPKQQIPSLWAQVLNKSQVIMFIQTTFNLTSYLGPQLQVLQFLINAVKSVRLVTIIIMS